MISTFVEHVWATISWTRYKKRRVIYLYSVVLEVFCYMGCVECKDVDDDAQEEKLLGNRTLFLLQCLSCYISEK